MRTRGIATSRAVLATVVLAGLAGCMTQSGLYHQAASSASTRRGSCGGSDSGTSDSGTSDSRAGAKTAPCAVTNPQALQQSNERYLQRVPVPAAQVAAAQPLRHRVQRGLKALNSRQRLQPRAVKGALIAAGLPATVYLMTGDPITFGASPWQNQKLCIYGTVAPHYVAVDVAGITEDGSCLPAQGNG
jgi:hypothetical protein